MRKTTIIETTLGDLIVALTDAAAESLPNPRDAHTVVALMLSDFLSGKSCAEV